MVVTIRTIKATAVVDINSTEQVVVAAAAEVVTSKTETITVDLAAVDMDNSRPTDNNTIPIARTTTVNSDSITMGIKATTIDKIISNNSKTEVLVEMEVVVLLVAAAEVVKVPEAAIGVNF